MKNNMEQLSGQSRQEAFIHHHKRYQTKIVLFRLMLFVFFLILWQSAASLGLIDSFFFSSPIKVAACFTELMMKQNLAVHIGITLFETLISFLLVFVIGMLFATLLWYVDSFAKIMEPYLVILNSLPKSALAPLFIVWLGTGTSTIIVAGVSVAVFGSVISLYTGFKQVDSEKLTLIYTLGGSKWDSFTKVVLPGSIPIILSTMKVNIGLALVGVIIGEFLAARRGLGYLIIYGSQVFQLNMVITSIVLLCIIAIVLYLLISRLERIYAHRL